MTILILRWLVGKVMAARGFRITVNLILSGCTVNIGWIGYLINLHSDVGCTHISATVKTFSRLSNIVKI